MSCTHVVYYIIWLLIVPIRPWLVFSDDSFLLKDKNEWIMFSRFYMEVSCNNIKENIISTDKQCGRTKIK